MFDEGVKDSLYRDKNMIMKVTPAFINSNWIQKDYHSYSVKVVMHHSRGSLCIERQITLSNL